MAVEKFITDKKLVEYLDEKLNSYLHDNGVYDIANYGWQSEDTEDPELIGHAMWQVDPPVEVEWEFIFGNGSARYRSTEKEKLLTVTGNDFEGLMKAGRLSIGLTLLHHSIAENDPLNDNHYFWLHHTDAILQLNMASDRIREYFIISFFDEISKSYKSKGKKSGWYVTPFIQARDLCQKKTIKKSIVDAVSLTPSLAEEIYKFRELRNSIVHDIATRLGKIKKKIIETQQHASDNGNSPLLFDDNTNYDLIKKQQEELEMKHKEELARAVDILIDWYKCLIKFTSLVFEAEHWLRKKPRNA